MTQIIFQLHLVFEIDLVLILHGTCVSVRGQLVCVQWLILSETQILLLTFHTNGTSLVLKHHLAIIHVFSLSATRLCLTCNHDDSSSLTIDDFGFWALRDLPETDVCIERLLGLSIVQVAAKNVAVHLVHLLS